MRFSTRAIFLLFVRNRNSSEALSVIPATMELQGMTQLVGGNCEKEHQYLRAHFRTFSKKRRHFGAWQTANANKANGWANIRELKYQHRHICVYVCVCVCVNMGSECFESLHVCVCVRLSISCMPLLELEQRINNYSSVHTYVLTYNGIDKD